MWNRGNVIFLILHLCAISNARICNGGRGFSENEEYRGSLPGVDERGGVEMNVPVEGNEYDECNDQAPDSTGICNADFVISSFMLSSLLFFLSSFFCLE